LTLLVWSFDLYKPVPDTTYNVFGGTLNLALSLSFSEINNHQYTHQLSLVASYAATNDRPTWRQC